MSTPAVLVDGFGRDQICALDRGFAFGDGVFRTLAIRAGAPLNWRHQYQRLAADCARLGLAVPDAALLASELRQVAPGDATAKVIVTRGAATRGYAIPAESRATRVVMAFPPAIHPASHRETGIAARRCELVLAEQPRVAGAKTLNRLENVLARGEWQDPAITEGLLGDARGHVVGGTMSNVFIVAGGRVATPDLSRCGIVGAQRERVRELLQGAGIECQVRDIGWDELQGADEVFLTNSLMGAWSVASLGARRWPLGPVTRRVQAMIDAADANP